MTLRELIEVVPRDGYLTLHIEKDWYAIQVNYVNIIRHEILDMNVTNILGGRCDGEPSLTVTLKSPDKEVSNNVHIDRMDMETLQ